MPETFNIYFVQHFFNFYDLVAQLVTMTTNFIKFQ